MQKGSKYSLDGNNSWLEKIRAYLEAQVSSARMLGVPRDPPTAAPPVTDTEEATLPRDLSPLISSLNSDKDNSMDDIVVEVNHRLLVHKELKDIDLYSDTITSGGHEFVIEGIPITHAVVT
jgi:hypothetical protein